MSDVVLSGIRATGRLHFGNFIGAVRNFVEYQKGDNTCLYFIADWHTMTTPYDTEELRSNLLEIVIDYLAAGLDPNVSTIYAQSSVMETAELSLLLGMLQPLGELMSVPTFKEKVRSIRKDLKGVSSDNIDEDTTGVNHGLLTYPVLMTADILGPKATLVPVGDDQVPNLELARSLAKRFNSTYGEIFPIPKMMTEMVRVPGLDGSKMGKSDADNAVGIDWPMDKIREAYKKRGVTDVNRVRVDDPGDPYNGCRSVYALHELITEGEATTREIANACRAGTIGCGDCKTRLCDSIAVVLEPFQERRAALANDRDYARDVLIEGGRRARDRIAPTLEEVREKMGLVRYD